MDITFHAIKVHSSWPIPAVWRYLKSLSSYAAVLVVVGCSTQQPLSSDATAEINEKHTSKQRRNRDRKWRAALSNNKDPEGSAGCLPSKTQQSRAKNRKTEGRRPVSTAHPHTRWRCAAATVRRYDDAVTTETTSCQLRNLAALLLRLPSYPIRAPTSAYQWFPPPPAGDGSLINYWELEGSRICPYLSPKWIYLSSASRNFDLLEARSLSALRGSKGRGIPVCRVLPPNPGSNSLRTAYGDTRYATQRAIIRFTP
ncbi:hypothetical protein WN51_13646 [Melipona quadrifasciata]|uniref:Uncharacterized protein n=1 Tax=Melipona quadrifasciata TaxID=166423 RepID=A0A0M9A0X8_9HYME|nr:hypothetical protein WN51_13646 [Melipona quadrifasciata]